MADVPKDLLAQIKNLEEIFTVPKETLQKVVTKFVKELEKGLAKEGSQIVSIRSQDTPKHMFANLA
jgi:hexokinase